MPEDFDPYRVLGLPVGASKREIKRRYRQLLRRHHPDVSDDPQRAHEYAAQIGRAYRALMDDARRRALEESAFSGLDPDLQVVVEQADPARSRVPELLRRAARLVDSGRLEEAQLVCSEVLALDADSAEAYEILGRTYDLLGRRELSQEMYREAERLRGIGPAPYRQAYTRPAQARASEPEVRARREIWVPGPVSTSPGRAVVGGVLALTLLLVGRWVAEEATPLMGISPVGLALGCGAAFLAAAGLAASGCIATFDQELGEGFGPRGGWPLWVLILAATLVSPALALVFHLLSALLGERLSGTTVGFWLVVAGVVALTNLLMPTTARFLWLGANAEGLAALAGWAVGGMVSPREWWR